MLAQTSRLTSKDVRYIQKIRKIGFSDHFRVQRVPQYANRAFHQISIYIAADKVHKASWRHYIKRRLIQTIMNYKLGIVNGKYYKIFFSLNPKNVTIDLRGKSAEERRARMDDMVVKFKKELPRLVQRMS